jgi:hypothetical protein
MKIALKQYITKFLPAHLQISSPNIYSSVADYKKAFFMNGGVVEAVPKGTIRIIAVVF